MKKVVVIGGGTGTYTVLTGLKKYPLSLTAVVSMMDSGGSNRVIRDEFGLLPTSDIRQCIVALASPNSNEILRQMFTYRYSNGIGVTGMTFGNLFMAALTDIYGSQEKAIQKTCEMFDIQGSIVPVTLDNAHLLARYENGKQVLGEHNIDEPDRSMGTQRIVELETIPKATANPKALQAIRQADAIILGPGDLFTSIICNLVVDGIPDAVKQSKAKKFFVLNLMTKFGQTSGFSTKDHLDELEKYLGKNVIDACLVNKSSKFSLKLLQKYEQEHAKPVKDNLDDTEVKVIRKDFVSNILYKKPKSDTLRRSLIRHDADKLAKAIVDELD